MPELLHSWSWLVLDTLTSKTTLNRIDSVNTCPCIFFLRNHRMWCAFDTWYYRECLLHKRLWKQPPIATTNPRDEMTVFGKTENFAPGSLLAKSSGVISLLAKFSLLAWFLQLSFPKIIFYIKILFPQVSQCISFLPIILKQFYNLCMASINIIRFNSRHIRN
jgi:hypothetical protein